MQKLIGIGVTLACVMGGFMAAGGKLVALWQPAELVIILGAAIGSTVLGNSKEVLHEMVAQVKGCFKNDPNAHDVFRQTLTLLYQLLDEIRGKGMKAVEDHMERPEDSPLFQAHPRVAQDPLLLAFIADNFRLLTMGKITPHELEGLLEAEIMIIEEDLLKPSHALHKTGEACPGFGILAAVMGIVITMQKLDGPLATIGVLVAAALVGTFIGIFLCYCFLEPIAHAMHENVTARIALLNCVKTIILCQLRGKTPIVAVDSGRKMLEPEVKPSFADLESWVEAKA
ncbi:MAG: flagellar motor stator protein MotA [Aeromonas sp.]